MLSNLDGNVQVTSEPEQTPVLTDEDSPSAYVSDRTEINIGKQSSALSKGCMSMSTTTSASLRRNSPSNWPRSPLPHTPRKSSKDVIIGGQTTLTSFLASGSEDESSDPDRGRSMLGSLSIRMGRLMSWRLTSW